MTVTKPQKQPLLAGRGPAAPRDAKRPPGRPSSGLPPELVMKNAVKNRRNRLISEGKVDFKTFINSSSKEGLQKLKIAMQVDTTGDVVDLLVQQELKRRQIG